MNDSMVIRVLRTAVVVGVVSLTVGCLGQDPKQGGVFSTTDTGQKWQAQPDLTDKSRKKPKEFPADEVNRVAASPGDTKVIIAGTSDDLWRSKDGGTSWERLTEKLPSAKKAIAVQSVRYHPTETTTFYVGGVSGGYGKIYKSTDGGDTLQDIFTVSKPAQTITALLIIPGVQATILAGDQLGDVYRSEDGGSTWRRTFTAPHPISSFIRTGQTILAATVGSGVMRSVDNGATFAPTNAGLADRQLTVWELAVSSSGIYAGTENGLMVSRDGGISWQEAITPLTAGQNRIQAVTASGSHVYFASRAVVYKFNPATGNFAPVQLKAIKEVYALAATNDSAVLYAGANNSSKSFGDRYASGLPGFQLNAPGLP